LVRETFSASAASWYLWIAVLQRSLQNLSWYLSKMVKRALGGLLPLRYLPVRAPPASGDQGRRPML